MNKYGLHGCLKAKAGSTEELAKILLQASTLVSEVKGCKIYLVSKDPKDSSLVWITEAWDCKEDHDQSLKIPAIREIIGKAMPLLDGMPTKGQELILLGGYGL